MQVLRLTVPFSAVLALTFSAAIPSLAESDWQKSYSVSGKPSVSVSTGDASLDVHSCGACREIGIRLEWNDRHPGEYNLTESHTGDRVSFELKEKAGLGFHIQFGNRHEPHVTVETPSELDLEARTSDGALKVNGVRGDLQLHTSDGAVDISDTGGALRLVASDGAIHIHNVTGTLESRSSDGHATIDGKFSAVQVHTSDGGLDMTFEEGSQLTGSSRIEGSDGRVTVRLPRSLSADLEVHTSDGKIDCQLPVTMNGYNSSGESGHNLRGRLNAGGPPLTIHTSDGNVTISAL
jgi:DUF4097 and DUF4098 domain-containing protein YvlB